MTEEHKASRTIVKSPPELWAECSVAQSLARHLGEFGEIRITRLEPETTVAWEGEHASGTVRLEPSGWGTQVTLTASPIVTAMPEPEVVPVEAAVPEPEPEFAQEVEVVQEAEVVEDAEVADDVEEPHAADESAEDDAEDVPEHLPRWQVFARLWGRLGRKAHDPEPVDSSDDDPTKLEPEDVEAVQEAPEVLEAAPERVDEAPQPVAQAAEPVEEAPAAVSELDHQALLVGALNSLGQAHHRPFSRA